MADTLEGILERIGFFNKENNFRVAKLQSATAIYTIREPVFNTNSRLIVLRTDGVFPGLHTIALFL